MKKKSSILIVDDEQNYLDVLRNILETEGYENIITEADPSRLPIILENSNLDLIILDNYFPGMNGLELIELITSNKPDVPIIMVTASSDIDTALKAIKLGAYEFLTKPPDVDRLFLTIERALEQRLLKLERDSLREIKFKEKPPNPDFHDIVTQNEQMQKVFELVEIFAPTNETMLIMGETGTGKDLIARKIHDMSPRKNSPFVVVNLASISSTLFESELFGYEKGAFTGAAKSHIGFFETANGGTIFLDEIGEMPKDLQGKLLRAIQYSEIYRLGNPKSIKLDIRIITATNKDLHEAVQHKEFRADLFYRINRGFIYLPPLRERGDDVLLLAGHFLQYGNKMYGKAIPGFSKETIKILKEYSYPGNVRELENIILTAAAKTQNNEPVTPGDLNLTINEISSEFSDEISSNLELSLDQVIERHILTILRSQNNNTVKAASILGISERTLQRRLQKLKVKRLV